MQKNGAEGQEYVTARDNVIFELGLCAMALGDKCVIIVHHEDVCLIGDLRGGGWGDFARYCRSAYRSRNDSGYRGSFYGYCGFRLCCSAGPRE